MIESKICTKCKVEKDFSQYGKNKKSKSGHENSCKECMKKNRQAYNRTKIGLMSDIFTNQVSSSIQRGHCEPKYCREWLYEWAISQENFNTLFDDWANSGYSKNKRPSVDRKNDLIGYTKNNIQLITWIQNKQKNENEQRIGEKINKTNPQKVVIQYDKDMNLIAEYHSVNEASRKTDSHQGHISESCSGKLKTHNGFIWRFKNE